MSAKTFQNVKWIRRWIPLAIATVAAALWTLSAIAGTKTVLIVRDLGTVTWLDYGEYTFPGGNMHIQGHAGINVEVSDDPNHTGLLYWTMGVQFDENGGGVTNMRWQLVAGTFEYDSEHNMVFGDDGIPVLAENGSVWEGNSHGTYRGETPTYHGVGHGVAGEVSGMQMLTESAWVESEGDWVIITTVLDPKAKK